MARIVAHGLNFTAMDDMNFLTPAWLLSIGFVTLLVLSVLLKFWLAGRQIRHVAQHRNQVPATFSSTITLAAHQKAADYTVAKVRLGLLETALNAVLLLGWTLLGALSTLNQYLLSQLGAGLLQQLALLLCFALIGAIIDLPLSLYQTFVLEQRFGFNKMTFKLWLQDAFKAALLSAAIGLPIAALMLWLMASSGGLWWLWAWGLWMGLNLLLLVIYPSLIAPLFNQFTALQDESLKVRVTALMQRCGFSAKGLFVMDGSKRSGHANAYFTGFGAAKRVVFFDTLLSKLNPAEIDAVLAHELGHFKHKHIIKRIGLMFALSLIGFFLLGWLSQQSWFYSGLGVTPNLAAANDALALLLFLLITPLLGFFISPLMALLSRQHEFQADAYAAAQTSGQDLAAALLKLYRDNASTLTPDALYAAFYYSHPSAAQRLDRLLPAANTASASA